MTLLALLLLAAQDDQSTAAFRGHTRQLHSVAITRDGKWIASGDEDAVIKLWSVEKKAEEGTLPGHSGAILGLAFSPDGKRLATVDDGGNLRIWDLAAGTAAELNVTETAAKAISWSPDGKTIAVAIDDDSVRLIDVAAMKERAKLPDLQALRLAYAPTGKYLAVASMDGTLKILDPGTGALRKALSGHNGNVKALAVPADGKTLATVSYDQTVRLWTAP